MTTSAAAVTDPIDVVLGRLKGVKESGPGNWIARCPCPGHTHDDRNPSLTVSVNGKGDVLLKCHAAHGHTALGVMDAIGLELKDLFSKLTQRRRPPKIVATYDYRDAGGELLHQTVRFDTSDQTRRFRQRRPDPDQPDQWIWNLRGVSPVLYRLPDVLAADPGVMVFVVEGEKDADKLWSLGLTATSSPMGACKWSYVDAAPLDGRRVVVIPDNDGPGWKHAQEVAQERHGRSASVKMIQLPGLNKAGGDVTDWLDDGHTTDDLADLILVAEEFRSPPSAKSKGESAKSPELVTLCLAEVQPQAIEWLWDRRFPISKLSILAGIPGVGKSFLMLDMAARISTGRPWYDSQDQPNPKGSILLLSAEDGANDTIRPRIDAAGGDPRRIHVVEGVRQPRPDQSEAETQDVQAFNLQNDLRLLGGFVNSIDDVRLVIIDPLDAYLGGGVDAHKSADVRRVLHPVARFAEQHCVSVIAVSHLNKTPATTAINKILGSIAFIAAARAGWLVAPDRDDRERRLFLPLKMNLAKPATGLAFRIEHGEVRWIDEEVDVTADEALAERQDEDEGRSGKLGDAVDFIAKALAEGDQRATDMKTWAKQNGITERTLARAKDKLGVVSDPIVGRGKLVWFWSLSTPAASSGSQET